MFLCACLYKKMTTYCTASRFIKTRDDKKRVNALAVSVVFLHVCCVPWSVIGTLRKKQVTLMFHSGTKHLNLCLPPFGCCQLPLSVKCFMKKRVGMVSLKALCAVMFGF